MPIPFLLRLGEEGVIDRLVVGIEYLIDEFWSLGLEIFIERLGVVEQLLSVLLSELWDVHFIHIFLFRY